jgi:hypothetical protein
MTFGAFALIAWEMLLFRKTFIPFLLPCMLFFAGGLATFLLVRKRMKYYDNRDGFFYQALHGTILFGGTIMFVFMAVNYYLRPGKQKCTFESDENRNVSQRRRL